MMEWEKMQGALEKQNKRSFVADYIQQLMASDLIPEEKAIPTCRRAK